MERARRRSKLPRSLALTAALVVAAVVLLTTPWESKEGGGAAALHAGVPAGPGTVTVSGPGGSADVHTHTPAWAAACRTRPCQFARMEDGEVDASVVSRCTAAAGGWVLERGFAAGRWRASMCKEEYQQQHDPAPPLCTPPLHAQPFVSQFGEDTWLFNNLFYNKRNGLALEFGAHGPLLAATLLPLLPSLLLSCCC